MLSNDTRIKIKNILEGDVIKGDQDTCTTIRNILCTSFSTSPTVKKDFESKQLVKKEQAVFLEKFSKDNNLWLTDVPVQDTYFARGGEALVYLNNDLKSVLKQNDAIYYATWLEFSIVFYYTIYFSQIRRIRFWDFIFLRIFYMPS